MAENYTKEEEEEAKKLALKKLIQNKTDEDEKSLQEKTFKSIRDAFKGKK